MSKYEPLARYLSRLESDSWDAELPEIERVLGFELPRSAYTYPAWWSNQEGAHSQTKGWREVGWETCNVNLPAKRIRFIRKDRARPTKAADSSKEMYLAEIEALIGSARELTGISDHHAVVAKALRHLIETEAARGLAALGGSDSQAAAPERRRFW